MPRLLQLKLGSAKLTDLIIWDSSIYTSVHDSIQEHAQTATAQVRVGYMALDQRVYPLVGRLQCFYGILQGANTQLNVHMLFISKFFNLVKFYLILVL